MPIGSRARAPVTSAPSRDLYKTERWSMGSRCILESTSSALVAFLLSNHQSRFETYHQTRSYPTMQHADILIPPKRDTNGLPMWRMNNLPVNHLAIVRQAIDTSWTKRCSVCNVSAEQKRLMTCGRCGHIRVNKVYYCVSPFFVETRFNHSTNDPCRVKIAKRATGRAINSPVIKIIRVPTILVFQRK